MLEHETEIMSRPARTWFQTTVEKAAAKSAGLAEHNLKFAEKKVRPSFKDRDDGKEREKDVSFFFRFRSRSCADWFAMIEYQTNVVFGYVTKGEAKKDDDRG